jgi:2-phosphosulfolactate phosphatase
VYYDQSEFDIRCEWGERGLAALSPSCEAAIIVDVLSFCTAVDIAASRGAYVIPYRYKDSSALEFARANGAIVAAGRGTPDALTLSPSSLTSIASGTRLVLPSPNGSALSQASRARLTLAGCLRNAKAVAQSVERETGGPIAVIPAGERWEDGTLRPAWEDLVGAGAIIHFLNRGRSPEAELALNAFRAAEVDLLDAMLACSSGRELCGRGFAADVRLAAELNCSDCAPTLRDGAYVAT